MMVKATYTTYNLNFQAWLQRMIHCRRILAAAMKKLLRVANHLLIQMKIYMGLVHSTVTERVYTRLAIPSLFLFHPEDFSRSATLNPNQYWSQEDPPGDVRKITDDWNCELKKAVLPPIKLYSRTTAFDYTRHRIPDLELLFSTAFPFVRFGWSGCKAIRF